MRTIAAILLAFTGLHAFSAEVRVAPPGAYTFSVTPTAGTSSSGEVLFEVTLGPP